MTTGRPLSLHVSRAHAWTSLYEPRDSPHSLDRALLQPRGLDDVILAAAPAAAPRDVTGDEEKDGILYSEVGMLHYSAVFIY